MNMSISLYVLSMFFGFFCILQHNHHGTDDAMIPHYTLVVCPAFVLGLPREGARGGQSNLKQVGKVQIEKCINDCLNPLLWRGAV